MSTPTEHDTEPLARHLYAQHFHAADSWDTDTGIRRGHYEGLAEAVLASDWLAQRDAAMIAKAKAEGWDEGYSHGFDLGPNEVRSLDDNPYRAAAIEASS